VAAGNRAEDRALVRTISSALINRVLILQIRIDVPEWLAWARSNGVRPDVVAFIEEQPGALLRQVPRDPVPFSTPRAWASLSRALDLAERGGILSDALTWALARGRVSAEDAQAFTTFLAVRRCGPRPEPAPRDKLDMSLAELELSVRATNCLESEGIMTVRDLVTRTEDELLEVRNFSERTLAEVKEKLAGIGLSLGMKVG
jgi:hypothetical protein